MTCAAKNATFKNQLRNFLRDENHLYGIILVHLTSNVALKTRKRLLAAGYRIFFKLSKLEISSHSLLTTVASLDPNEAAHGHHFTPQQQTHQWVVSFGVPTSVRPVCLVFSFIFNQAVCLLLHPTKPYQSIHFPYQHCL